MIDQYKDHPHLGTDTPTKDEINEANDLVGALKFMLNMYDISDKIVATSPQMRVLIASLDDWVDIEPIPTGVPL